MDDFPALAALLLLPALGAALVPLLRPATFARASAMAVMLAVAAIAVRLVVAFDPGVDDARFAFEVAFLPSIGVDLAFRVDGYNVYLLLLTAVLFPVVLGCAWSTREGESPFFVALLLALEAALLGTFLAQNLVVLFVLWEAVLIPMVLLILVFGGERRRRAAMTFFLYTMAGSVPLLAAVILLGVESVRQTGHWSFALDALARLSLSAGTQAFVFASVALACAVKSPLVPFHAWLPLAYREASYSGTALMAGVLSKMGAYGFLRLAIPLCPDVAHAAAPLMVALAVVTILYGAVLALRERDSKRLVAYASLSHMGYIVLGLWSFEPVGVHGAMFQILSHGLGVAGLFLLLGLVERRTGASMQAFALARRAPRLAVVLMLFVLASLALPLTSGFTAEFMVLMGAVSSGLASVRAGTGAGLLVGALLAAGGVVLGATYMLRFARTALYGRAPEGAARVADLGAREALALAPLLALILWVGVWPAAFMTRTDVAATTLARPVAALHATAAEFAADTPGALRDR